MLPDSGSCQDRGDPQQVKVNETNSPKQRRCDHSCFFLYNVVFREDKTSQLVLVGYIVPFEEKYLAKEFPEEWQDYAANVKRYGIL